MPPKPKCTREEVAAAALEIIKEDGLSGLTARELGSRLGTSSRPIFTVYHNMEEVKLAARELALEEFHEFISDYEQYTPAFKRIGMMMVSYGLHEPELFKLLFMQEHKGGRNFEETIKDLGETAQNCVRLVERDYDLTEEAARLLFEQMWTHAFGLGALCATGVCDLSEDEIGSRLGVVFAGMLMLIKSEKIAEVYSDVEVNTTGNYHGKKIREMPFRTD
ncbi:MAG: TetR/AcrR family transcriptional regulator [bacterium]|nr:TetR/AcrR family transcriptional regulator [bacterium]